MKFAGKIKHTPPNIHILDFPMNIIQEHRFYNMARLLNNLTLNGHGHSLDTCEYRSGDCRDIYLEL